MNLKLFACGDIVNSKNNHDWISKDIIDIIQRCDFAIGNLEAPIKTNDMKPIAKAGPHIYQSPSSPSLLKKAGFTHVSLSNNHIFDYGEKAFKNTRSKLEIEGLQHFGSGESFEESYLPKVLLKQDLKIGIISACENEFGCHFDESLNRSGYAYLFSPVLEDAIISLKKETDFIVLFAHAGIENIPIPLKEWRDRYRRLCELGVDVVVGHHPHVPQGYEYFGKCLIFYSLGNFYFDIPQYEKRSDDSYSLILEFSKNIGITFEVVYHKKIKGSTTLVSMHDVDFDLNELRSLLKEEYDSKLNSYLLKIYFDYYKEYYELAAGKSPKKLKIKIIQVFKNLLGLQGDQRQKNGLLLLHNIRIESHRFAVQRALSLLYEK